MNIDVLLKLPYLKQPTTREIRDDFAAHGEEAKVGIPSLIRDKDGNPRAVLMSPEDANRFYQLIPQEELEARAARFAAETSPLPTSEESKPLPNCEGCLGVSSVHQPHTKQHPGDEVPDHPEQENVTSTPHTDESLKIEHAQTPPTMEAIDVSDGDSPSTEAQASPDSAPASPEIAEDAAPSEPASEAADQSAAVSEEQVTQEVLQQTETAMPAMPVQPLIPAKPELGIDEPIDLSQSKVQELTCQVETITGKPCTKGLNGSPGIAVSKVQLPRQRKNSDTGELENYPPINICQAHLDGLKERNIEPTMLGEPS